MASPLSAFPVPSVPASAVSPLAAWKPAYPGFRELPFLTQVDLRGGTPQEWAAALGVVPPTAPNTVAVAGDLAVLWLGPDEWLAVAPAGTALATPARLSGSAVDVSAHRTTIEVTGPPAWDILAHGCALDGLAPGRCAQTLLARSGVILWALDDGYRVLVRASFARYVADWLDDAALEHTA